MKQILAFFLVVFVTLSARAADELIVEAESFAEYGGWKLDTQFIEIMGSPYLLAHGLGNPVADAETQVTIPAAGTYHVWARTKDWVAPWNAEGAPGKFKISINGNALSSTFGTEGADWHWQSGGTVDLAAGEIKLSLIDLTGFNGRCDAIAFTKGASAPSNDRKITADQVEDAGEFDMVFVGGGYAGMCGAVAAARMGIKTALIQNRPVLGGNGSAEVRVWAKGNTPGGLYPIGDIIEELSDHAKASPGTYEEFGDAKKEKIVRAEKNLSLFLEHHASDVVMDGNRIVSVHALDIRKGVVRNFRAPYFCDATGHGYIGMKAGADLHMIPDGRMGMSNMWSWKTTDKPVTFPETPWALDLDEKGFPYPNRYHAQWFWESGYDKHPLNDLELIRDWNLRANFGAWHAIKNKGAYARSDKSGKSHAQAELKWMAYVGGTRETQQLLGDVILTEEDVVSGRQFPDAAVLTTWSIDLHYPKAQYIGKYADNPFISYAVHGKGVDRKKGYPVPYRCFYSRNIENLFMAGRNVSVTHKALGTVRVMKTGGMMGVVVGKAAAVARRHNASPREVYTDHLPELIESMKLPGNMRRAHLTAELVEDPSLPKFVAKTPAQSAGGIEPSSLKGIVIDDDKAVYTGKWGSGTGISPFVGTNYRYSSDGTARYSFTVTESGTWDLRVNWAIHENRSTKTKVTIEVDGKVVAEKILNQRQAPLMKHGFHSLGRRPLKAGQKGAVIFSSEGADGNIHADVLQLIKVN